MTTHTLLVRQDQLGTTRIAARESAPLADGQIRVRVDTFALTSNNISYAAHGESMSYWRFFPTEELGWGIVPAWGFGCVEQSLHPGVAVGERLYGFWPMASEAVLQPDRVSLSGFRDATAHRAELHAVYNQYPRCSADPFYTADSEDVQALLRPLFITSWLADDFIADNDFFGADTMLLSSASSKTAYGTAFLLKQRPGIEVVGLTSAANRAFCESLGCYSRVLAYDELDQVADNAACVYIDFACNAQLRRSIHTRFADLKYSCSIGFTHVEQFGSAHDLPGPRPTLFFAPAQVKKRQTDWGAAELGKQLVQAWRTFSTRVGRAPQPWLTVQHHSGADEVARAFAHALTGRGDPRVGQMLSMS